MITKEMGSLLLTIPNIENAKRAIQIVNSVMVENKRLKDAVQRLGSAESFFNQAFDATLNHEALVEEMVMRRKYANEILDRVYSLSSKVRPVGRKPKAEISDRNLTAEINKMRRQIDLEPIKPKQRDCLTCNKSFKSRGPANRMCENCRVREGVE